MFACSIFAPHSYVIMLSMEPDPKPWNIIIPAVIIVVLAGLLGAEVWRYRSLVRQLSQATIVADTLRGEQIKQEQKITALEASTTLLSSALASSSAEKIELESRLGIVVSDNSSLAQRVVATQNQIAVLDKLRFTDKELLVKYSKVFFLNENYVPSALATITPALAYDGKKELRIHADVKPFLERMMADARASGHPLALVSAYRSFKDQATLKSAYSMTFGSGANKFSADQGFSEHQLGTTVDITTPTLGTGFTNFATTDGYAWLTANAYKYGFVLSYPKNNSYYMYEPWHWRFVGIVLSARLRQEGKYFYDLPQRDIDGYLIDIFTLKETMEPEVLQP
jgi:LAS superfamily LD-carboxypeptidase LdcB